MLEGAQWPTTRLISTGLLAVTVPFCIGTMWIKYNAKRLPLPPSPPSNLWVGGHRYLMPKPGDKHLFWQVFTKLAREHGDVMYLSIDGEDTIILSSYEAINDLFVTRGTIYSDRQVQPWLTDVMGWKNVMSFRQCDDYWRKSRRLANIGFGKQAAETYHAAQAKAVHQFLQRIVSHPDEWRKDLDCMVALIIMRIIYGYTIEGPSDPFIKFAYGALNSVQATRYTPSWAMSIIKRFPILCSFPSWLPGMGWKRRWLKERHWIYDTVERPWDWTKKKMATGTASPSFVSKLLEENNDGLDGEDAIKWVSGGMFIAGSHTTVAAVSNFILAMVLHPDVVRRAQNEIDCVVGSERLPGIMDQDKLIYVECLILEVLRWRAVAPLGVEDEYRGYRIPAGSIVASNLYAVMHDEKLFPEPHLFKPERFLDEHTGKQALPGLSINPRDIIFGIGRRSCPGFRVASTTLFLTIASMLATMDFARAKGDESDLEVGYVSGLVSMPLPFKCSIKPRSEAAVKLINETVLFEQE
ncbi:cytochrome P450 family protein [Ceratobasidium sp. AG-Ba]|nr:cytochrome P450 family protein [Ceratobasidium sp. AG-Ba]